MTSLKVNPQFLIDETGERSSVLLTMRDYRRFLRHVEDLEDALALDHAIKTSSKMLKAAGISLE
jgi:hypothetical protein